MLFLAYLTQTVGLQYTTASRSAFITTLYVVALPMLLGLLGQRLGWPIWLAAGLAIGGWGSCPTMAPRPTWATSGRWEPPWPTPCTSGAWNTLRAGTQPCR